MRCLPELCSLHFGVSNTGVALPLPANNRVRTGVSSAPGERRVSTSVRTLKVEGVPDNIDDGRRSEATVDANDQVLVRMQTGVSSAAWCVHTSPKCASTPGASGHGVNREQLSWPLCSNLNAWSPPIISKIVVFGFV